MNRIFLPALFALLIASALSQAAAAQEGPAGTIHEALRIRVNGKAVLGEADLQNMNFSDSAAAMAAFRKNIVTLQREASVQLTVEAIDAQGRATNVTTNPAITYQSLAPARLSVSPAGVVTAAPSPDARQGIGGDLAIEVVFERESQQAWNKIFFNIVP